MTGTGMERKYKCIFFDLDHTLWDYEVNSRQTLEELYVSYDLQAKGVTDLESFCRQFRRINTQLWELYDSNKIDQRYIREQRFRQILECFSAYSKDLCEDLSADYLVECPKKGNLLPHAKETLEYLSSIYRLTVVTNGFDEIQNVKLRAGNLTKYFSHIVTSQRAGHRKPSEKIFEYALTANKVRCRDAAMVGDNLLTDIAGARNASIDAIFFNPGRLPHEADVNHEIASLAELTKIL